jgi:hypothetical protein
MYYRTQRTSGYVPYTCVRSPDTARLPPTPLHHLTHILSPPSPWLTCALEHQGLQQLAVRPMIEPTTSRLSIFGDASQQSTQCTCAAWLSDVEENVDNHRGPKLIRNGKKRDSLPIPSPAHRQPIAERDSSALTTTTTTNNDNRPWHHHHHHHNDTMSNATREAMMTQC